MSVHKITGLKVQKKNNQRVNVYLDGEFAFGLRRIVAAWLNTGQEINDEKIEQLKIEDTIEEAYQVALRQLEHRPRSEAEIRKKLQEKNLPDDVQESVLHRLKRAKLINDNLFAQAWVENRNEFRPRGSRALAFELRQKGLEAQTIDETLENIDDETLAFKAARKYSLRLYKLEWPDFRQKLTSFLARRGFDYEISKRVVLQIWSEQQEMDKGENSIEYINEEIE